MITDAYDKWAEKLAEAIAAEYGLEPAKALEAAWSVGDTPFIVDGQLLLRVDGINFRLSEEATSEFFDPDDE